tara:strand:- start:353 stop:985 length:633 start_codon:yes stop_codon:yes gene_type:complete
MFLSDYKVIFWDFDGVIKESLAAKTQSFRELFNYAGIDFMNRVETHHLENGGMSRFQKIPLYLSWLDKNTDDNVNEYLDRFKKMTVKKVISSDWVVGAKEYIVKNSNKIFFYIVTGTPEEEIKFILKELNLMHCFSGCYGSPSKKEDIILSVLGDNNFQKKDCIMVGDAIIDKEAAEKNNINFLLRLHEDNVSLFKDYTGAKVFNFKNEL